MKVKPSSTLAERTRGKGADRRVVKANGSAFISEQWHPEIYLGHGISFYIKFDSVDGYRRQPNKT